MELFDHLVVTPPCVTCLPLTKVQNEDCQVISFVGVKVKYYAYQRIQSAVTDDMSMGQVTSYSEHSRANSGTFPLRSSIQVPIEILCPGTSRT